MTQDTSDVRLWDAAVRLYWACLCIRDTAVSTRTRHAVGEKHLTYSKRKRLISSVLTAGIAQQEVRWAIDLDC